MAGNGPWNVLLVDDHAIIRRGLKDVIRQNLHTHTVLESSSCAELGHMIARHAPDLVLLDLQLTDCNAMERIALIKAVRPQARVLVYSMRGEHFSAQQALSHGASGYLSKASDERELVLAIRKVLEGGIYLSQEMELYLSGSSQPGAPQRTDPFRDLSDREAMVMNELLKGSTVKEIAARLDLQPTTVATYKARIFDKLQVHNLLDLHRLVMRHRNPEAEPS